RLGTAENGMVASLRYEASAIGVQIMEQGGNAVDAAVATALALTVTMPEMCGVSGGGLMTWYDAATGETTFLSFRETAPMFQTADMWVQDETGAVVGNRNLFSGLAIGVPGEIAGLYQALQDYGTMEWAEVIQPAIDIAREGFIVTPELREYILYLYDIMAASTELSEIYLTEDGMVPEVNDVIRNEYLANTLEIIRDRGPEGFYTGAVAEAMVKATQAAGGLLTMEDLAAYEPWYEEPAIGTYRGYTVASAASPSSGGTFIIEALNILEQLPVLEYDSVERWHQLAEVQKIVWADRAEFMADIRFVDVPVKGLTSKEYAAARAAEIDMEHAGSYSFGNAWDYDNESENTTSFSVADKAGNMVTITHTINRVWGSRIYVPGYGFFMNNQLGDFVVGSGYSNSLEPGKAPLSSMSPTVVLDPEGKPFMTLGSPGGVQIFPSVTQCIINVIDYGMNIEEALNSPRIAATSTSFNYSKELSDEILAGLEALGHEGLDDINAVALIGLPSGIMYMPDGTMQGSVEREAALGEFGDGAAIGF
ncbi:MAG: gamma-glutamyltransferase, partial [Oscillospiraceae bacterium]|nr:gamma-glutamyltransferase [Oscillospiraceae bacterium]